MKLLAHIAEYHIQEPSEIQDKETEDDEINKKNDKNKEIASFEFNEAMLDEFIDTKK